jgi:hypothetical protein
LTDELSIGVSKYGPTAEGDYVRHSSLGDLGNHSRLLIAESFLTDRIKDASDSSASFHFNQFICVNDVTIQTASK